MKPAHDRASVPDAAATATGKTLFGMELVRRIEAGRLRQLPMKKGRITPSRARCCLTPRDFVAEERPRKQQNNKPNLRCLSPETERKSDINIKPLNHSTRSGLLARPLGLSTCLGLVLAATVCTTSLTVQAQPSDTSRDYSIERVEPPDGATAVSLFCINNNGVDCRVSYPRQEAEFKRYLGKVLESGAGQGCIKPARNAAFMRQPHGNCENLPAKAGVPGQDRLGRRA
jgi:hypothetical protein